MKKRILLFVVMMFCAVSVFAQDTHTDGQGIMYTLTTNGTTHTAEVSGHTDNLLSEIVIPATIISSKGTTYNVTSIGYGTFKYCTSLTSVTIPNSVTSIGEYAFFSCTSLTSVTIPNSVTSIGDDAFLSCKSLASVTIPNSVTSIGVAAFSNSGLTSVNIPNSVTSIGQGVFNQCFNLTSVIIPSSVTSIGTNLFARCASITDVYFYCNPENLSWGGQFGSYCVVNVHVPSAYLTKWQEKFGASTEFTFVGENSYLDVNNTDYQGIKYTLYDNLTADVSGYNSETIESEIDVPETVVSNGKTYSVTSIANSGNGFKDCEKITSVTIPNSVTSIGENAFYKTGLTSVNIPSSVTSIGNSAFSNTGLTSVTIPNKVTSFGNSAFESCTALASVTITNGVTSIGESAFKNCSKLTSVTIPNSVTSIGNSAFSNTGLTSVTIPNSVTSIGNSAFWYCTGLTSVTIPNSVTSIGDCAFESCTALTSVTIPNSVTSIGKAAFAYSGLTSVNIPSSVTSIDQDAFFDCTSITDVYCYADPELLTWNEYNCNDFKSGRATKCHVLINYLEQWNTKFQGVVNVAFVGDKVILEDGDTDNQGIIYTFDDDSRTAKVSGHTKKLLSVLSIPSTINILSNDKTYTVTSIGNDAFADCYDLTSVNIPNSVESIGERVFQSCEKLASVTIPNSVTSIGNDAFRDCSSLTSVTIPNRVTSIAKRVFQKCNNLASVIIPNSVTSIAENAFLGCKSLTSVTIPDGVTSIGESAFESCKGLTTVTIPNSVTSIGAFVFRYCTGLTSVTIPNSVTSIGQEAFYACTSITDVYCYADPELLTWNEYGCDDFQSGRATKCHVLINYLEQWNTKFQGVVNVAFVGDMLVLEDGNTDYQGIIYTFDDDYRTAKVSGHTEKLLSVLSIPSTITILSNDKTYTVTSIGNNAFENCYDLTSVTIPNSVTSIGNFAFYKTGLASVTIPNSVTSIGECAFAYSGLTSVTIPNSVTSIGKRAFSYCASLASVTIPNSVTSIGEYAFCSCTSLTSVTIPNSVTSIGESTFFNCTSLTSVTIPNSVTSIGNYAFYNCSSLTSVTIPNSVTSIGKDAFYDCSNMTDVYCYANPENLTWNENLCSDFKEDGTTKCHVPSSDFKKWHENFHYDVNVTFVGDLDNNSALTFSEDGDVIEATINGDFNTDDILAYSLDEEITVDKITFSRAFNGKSTIMLPFEIPAGQYSGGTFCKFNGVYYDKGKKVWYVEAEKVSENEENIAANTPYIFCPSGDNSTLSISGSVKLEANSKDSHTYQTGNSDVDSKWSFVGVYKRNYWAAANTRVYGFAGSDKTDDEIKVGDFVRAGDKSYIKPFRCYLQYYSDDDLSKSAATLPDRIEVRIINETSAVVDTDDPTDDTSDITTPTSELATPVANVKVWSYDKTIFISAQPGTDYSIVDANGRTLRTATTQTDRDEVRLGSHSGIAVVIINGKTFKVIY